MQLAHLVAALSMVTMARATCDEELLTANAVTLSQACTDDLQGGPPPTIATVFADYRSNPNKIFKYGLCGSATCKAEISALTYPTCSPTTETSYMTEISAFAGDCTALDAAVAANGGTCTSADIADNIWAKTVVKLDADCATAVGKTANRTWYTTAFKPLGNSFSYCVSTACLSIAGRTQAKLTSCTDGTDSKMNLYEDIRRVLKNCGSVTTIPTPAPTRAPIPSSSAIADYSPQWWPTSNTTTARPTNSPTVTPSPNTLFPTAAPASATPVLSSSTQIKMSFGLTCDCTCHF